MPLDFSLWAEIERRVLEVPMGGPETAKSYQGCLRAAAKSLTKAMVSDCLQSMAKRFRMIVDASTLIEECEIVVARQLFCFHRVHGPIQRLGARH